MAWHVELNPLFLEMALWELFEVEQESDSKVDESSPQPWVEKVHLLVCGQDESSQTSESDINE